MSYIAIALLIIFLATEGVLLTLIMLALVSAAVGDLRERTKRLEEESHERD